MTLQQPQMFLLQPDLQPLPVDEIPILTIHEEAEAVDAVHT